MNESQQHKRNDESLDADLSQETYDLLAMLEPAPAEAPQPSVAFARLQTKLKMESDRKIASLSPLPVQEGQRFIQSGKRRLRPRWMMAAVAASLALLLILPNANVLAQQFLSLFRVQQFQPVTINPQQLNSSLIQDLASFGDTQIQFDRGVASPRNPTKAEVEQYTHFPFLLPERLPDGVGNVVHFSIVNGGHATFVFNMAKARAYLKKIGDDSIAIPAQLANASYAITLSPGAIANYTNNCSTGDTHKGADSAKTTGSSSAAQCNAGNHFTLLEIPAPTIDGTGKASINDLRNFMLSLPHLPAPIHELLLHVDVQSGTVPVPLPPQANSRNVTVQGASGILMSDHSVSESILLWQTHNMVYVISAHTGNSAQLLDAANSLS